MTRNLRVWYPGAIYHITARGNRKNNLFRDRKDYNHYVGLMQRAKEKTPFLLNSYCLMPNHVHLIIGTLNDPLSDIIHYIHSIYARYFNRKYHYVGHVFQDRYYAKLIKNSKQLIDTSSYVHLNPVKSKYSKKPEDYHWSSYKNYISAGDKSIVDTQKIFSYLGDSPYEKYKFYVEMKYKIKDWNEPLLKY